MVLEAKALGLSPSLPLPSSPPYSSSSGEERLKKEGNQLLSVHWRRVSVLRLLLSLKEYLPLKEYQ